MSHFITISSGLLTTEHRLRMQVNQKTSAIWMYLWFIDKMTNTGGEEKLGQVLGGKPLKLEDIDTGQDIKTTRKVFAKLEKEGYIRTRRTPYGRVVWVTKAKKIFGQKVTAELPHNGRSEGASELPRSGRSDEERDLPYSGRSEAPELPHNGRSETEKSNNLVGLKTSKKQQSGRSLPKKRQQSGRSNKTINNLQEYREDGVGVNPTQGSHEKSMYSHLGAEIIKAFEEVDPVNKKHYANTTQRAAADFLIDTYGLDFVLKVIKILPRTNKEPYFPNITTPNALMHSWVKLQNKVEQRNKERQTVGRGLA